MFVTSPNTFAVENRNVVGSQSRFRLNADEERATPPGRHTFIGKQFTLKTQSERAFLKVIEENHYFFHNTYPSILDSKRGSHENLSLIARHY